MHLEWDDWFRHDDWRDDFDAFRFGPFSFTQVLWEAMQQLHLDLAMGHLAAAANAIVAANPRNGFTEAEQDRYLLQGKFKFRRFWRRIPGPGNFPDIPVNFPPLLFKGFTAAEQTANPNAFGMVDQIVPANQPGNVVKLHMQFFVAWSQRPVRAANFPLDSLGKRRLALAVAATIIHEVLHLHGYIHGNRPAGAYNPANPYFRTFPEVAEAALLQHHAAEFGGNPPLSLTGSANESFPSCRDGL